MVQKADVTSKSTAPVKGKNGNGGSSDDADWVKFETERYMWNAEGATMPIQGFLLDLVDMPPGENGDWQCLLIRTTAACQVKDPDDRDGNSIIKVEAGVDVLVPMTYQLSEIAKVAQHPTFVYEVRIATKSKRSLGGGKSMWRYDAQIKKTPKDRDAFGPMFGPAPEVPQLPPSVEDTSAGGYSA